MISFCKEINILAYHGLARYQIEVILPTSVEASPILFGERLNLL